MGKENRRKGRDRRIVQPSNPGGKVTGIFGLEYQTTTENNGIILKPYIVTTGDTSIQYVNKPVKTTGETGKSSAYIPTPQGINRALRVINLEEGVIQIEYENPLEIGFFDIYFPAFDESLSIEGGFVNGSQILRISN